MTLSTRSSRVVRDLKRCATCPYWPGAVARWLLRRVDSADHKAGPRRANDRAHGNTDRSCDAR